MSNSAYGDHTDSRDRTATTTPPGFPERTDQRIDTEILLSLLSDEHARSILEELGDEGLPARTVAERLDLSRATVYRRLNRLEAAGVVETSMAVHSEGHHRKHYRATLDQVSLAFSEEGVVVESVEARTSSPRSVPQ